MVHVIHESWQEHDTRMTKVSLIFGILVFALGFLLYFSGIKFIGGLIIFVGGLLVFYYFFSKFIDKIKRLL